MAAVLVEMREEAEATMKSVPSGIRPSSCPRGSPYRLEHAPLVPQSTTVSFSRLTHLHNYWDHSPAFKKQKMSPPFDGPHVCSQLSSLPLPSSLALLAKPEESWTEETLSGKKRSREELSNKMDIVRNLLAEFNSADNTHASDPKSHKTRHHKQKRGNKFGEEDRNSSCVTSTDNFFDLLSPVFSLFPPIRPLRDQRSVLQEPRDGEISTDSKCSVNTTISSSDTEDTEAGNTNTQDLELDLDCVSSDDSEAEAALLSTAISAASVVHTEDDDPDTEDATDADSFSTQASPEQAQESEYSNPYLLMKRLQGLCSIYNYPRQPVIKQKSSSSPSHTLVLDLDETLVHCSTEPIDSYDLTFDVTFNDVEYKVYARKRPNMEKFLQQMSSMFEVVVFTASQQVYADKLLDIIDPSGSLIKYRVFRDSCTPIEGNYLKDLRILGRDLSKVVIVDNSPQAFVFQMDNGIPIESWFEKQDDTGLLDLIPFLEQLKTVDDVRPLVREKFGTARLVEQSE